MSSKSIPAADPGLRGEGVVLFCLPCGFSSSCDFFFFYQNKLGGGGCSGPQDPSPRSATLFSVISISLVTVWLTPLSSMPFIQNVETTLVSTFYCAFSLDCPMTCGQIQSKGPGLLFNWQARWFKTQSQFSFKTFSGSHHFRRPMTIAIKENPNNYYAHQNNDTSENS